MKIFTNTKLLKASGLALVAGAMLSACGTKDAAGDGTTTTTISGALQLSSLNNQLSIQNADTVRFVPTAITSTWSVRCVTLSGTPQAGVGSVNPDTGAFSLSLLVSAGAPIGCFVLDDTNIVATVVFKEAAQSMTGSSKRAGTFVANSGASALEFGTIAVNTSTGVAEVNVTNIVQTGGSQLASSWADPTGAWNFQMFCDANLMASTAEYEACTAQLTDYPDESSGSLYFKQYTASDGTETKIGLSLWETQAALTVCGGEGVTLPSGWTVSTGSEGLTTAITFAGLPALADVPATFAPCGTQNVSNCSQVTNVGSWGGLSDNDCKAMCVANNIWNYRNNVDTTTTCLARVAGNNWNYSGAKTYTVGASFIGTGTGAGQYLMKFSNNPQARIVVSEAEIKGSAASVMAYEEQDESACINRQNNGSCTSVTCTVVRTESINFLQTSATTMKVEVNGVEKLASDAPAGCLASDSHIRSWLGESGESKRRFFVNMTKQ